MPEEKPIAALSGNAMTTLETMLEVAGIAEADADSMLKSNIVRLINAASAWFETMTGRSFGRRAYVERHEGSGAQKLVLGQWPILSVEYVKDTRRDAVLSPDSYEWWDTGRIGVLYKDDGWPSYGYPQGLANDCAAFSRYLEISYTAGYVLPKDGTEETPATLPADIQSVVWGIVQQELSIIRNGAQGLAAFSVSDVSWTFDKEPRASWMSTVNHYLRY